MTRRLVVLTATAWVVCVTGFISARVEQDPTDKPAVQDAMVEFGYPVHPQPPAPAHHTLNPDEVTVFKGGTVTFTMHGMGHGVAIYPVSKNTTRAHIAEDLCQGSSRIRSPRTLRCATLLTAPPPCPIQLPTGTAGWSSTLPNFQPRGK